MQVTFKPLVPNFSEIPEGGVLVVPSFEKDSLDFFLEKLDEKARENIQHALKVSNFKGKKGQSLSLTAPQYTCFDRIIFFGAWGKSR